MYEYILHHVWFKQRFSGRDLTTTDGRSLQILHPGEYNENSGPDFLNAVIRIDQERWAGAVEIHLKSSDWYDHGHQTDKQYDSVILHVCLEENKPVILSDGTRIPCLELHERIPGRDDWVRHSKLNANSSLLCEPFRDEIDDALRLTELQERFLTRMERKASALITNQTSSKIWEDQLNQQIISAFGMRTNKMTFEMLAAQLDYRLIARIHDQPIKLEAYLFGIAGLLNESVTDDYVVQLRREFRLLQLAHDLHVLPNTIWNFLRMRPANFPTIRLAQLSALLHHFPNPARSCKESATPKYWKKMFQFPASAYWNTHFTFNKPSAYKSKLPGNAFVEAVILNGILPALYADAQRSSDELRCNAMLNWFESLPAEKNTLVEVMKQAGFTIGNAAHSQGAIELNREGCRRKRCDQCSIGRYLLSSIVREIDEGTRYRNMEIHR
ncbi:MAG: DUF2851 family protein [Flavobacteriales bacterium]|nr:DUF2851 family protein [Bacteroidota bacterium]MCB9240455.1 DUF2851 family protein [Flavobacteriales bacterium]